MKQATVQTSSSGVEALELLRCYQPDVLVSDLAMPYLSGLDLLHELRSLCSDLPVVLISGYVRPEDQSRAMQYGVHEIMLKPDTVEELGIALDRAFRQTMGATNGQNGARPPFET